MGMALAGLADSLYLTGESLSSQIPLYCPSQGILNCASVTSSSFSRFAGVPVASLGAVWFGLMALLFWANRESLNYALIPLWVMSAIGVSYLVFVELVVLHAICPYCTVAHALGLALVVPAVKVTLAD